MRLMSTITGLWHAKRPVLRVQLTLLYSGLFLGILAAVLLATGLLYQHSSQQAPPGTPADASGLGSGGRAFDVGPALIALVAAAVAVTGAWWLAGRFLRPLRMMTATAQEISASNLSRRLELSGSSDELAALGATLNDLFARLEATFAAQRHFVANASHELRTPLAGQRTLLQVALADPDANTESLRAACEEALQLGEQQERLIAALLTLASSEQGIQKREPLDLAVIAATVLADRTETAERLGITIDRSLKPAPAKGDRVLHRTPREQPGRQRASTTTLPTACVTVSTDDGRRRGPPDDQQHRTDHRRRRHRPAVPAVPASWSATARPRWARARTGHRPGHRRAHGAHLIAQPHPGGGLDIEVILPAATNRPASTPIIAADPRE